MFFSLLSQNHLVSFDISKCQTISKANYGLLKSPKTRTKRTQDILFQRKTLARHSFFCVSARILFSRLQRQLEKRLSSPDQQKNSRRVRSKRIFSLGLMSREQLPLDKSIL